jgi:hypothetical protein
VDFIQRGLPVRNSLKAGKKQAVLKNNIAQYQQLEQIVQQIPSTTPHLLLY